MRNVTKENITEVFASYYGDQTNPRTREVMVSLANHLHDFARDVNLTHDEWRKGLEFFEWAGKITTPERNEYVLLSDVMGLSSLVDMLHSTPEATSSSVLGPFHVSNPPPLQVGGDIRSLPLSSNSLACFYCASRNSHMTVFDKLLALAAG